MRVIEEMQAEGKSLVEEYERKIEFFDYILAKQNLHDSERIEISWNINYLNRRIAHVKELFHLN